MVVVIGKIVWVVCYGIDIMDIYIILKKAFIEFNFMQFQVHPFSQFNPISNGVFELFQSQVESS